jgi:hypothetical protein
MLLDSEAPENNLASTPKSMENFAFEEHTREPVEPL